MSNTTTTSSHAGHLVGHPNPAQLRMDGWQRLLQEVDRLKAPGTDRDDLTKLRSGVVETFNAIAPLERYWAFPGKAIVDRLIERFEREDYELLSTELSHVVHRIRSYNGRTAFGEDTLGEGSGPEKTQNASEHHFTVLVVDDVSPEAAEAFNHRMSELQRDADDFAYSVVLVRNLEDALAAVLYNPDIQACVLSYDFPLHSDQSDAAARAIADECESRRDELEGRGPLLGRILTEFRSELDVYLLTDVSVEELDKDVHGSFRRVFYRLEDLHELHMTVIDGVRERYRTPLFDALKHYAEKPIGNFHALPVARGNSVFNSKWIQDMGEFYGENIFLAESSSTSGGLDSLLAPKGPIKEAQEAAARAFGSRQTFFATNGTSTSNKVVGQALLQPGDIVLIDRNCHKSHHYGMVLAGAHPVYLDAYPLEPYAIYGAVPLRTIKQQLLELKRAGRLDRVKMVLLTNCTFDGIVYHPQKVMEELLAIKPDLCFLWDEAWFAFARLSPIVRQRTAMFAANALHTRFRSSEYREEYATFRAEFDQKDPQDDSTWLDSKLLPDPDEVRIRVYATQSTHKSLSALRQGSMIHIWDEDFARKTEDAFHEAFFTHTSTSPNYQILASLDLARRQVELEGYGLLTNVQNMALAIREKVKKNPDLAKYFRILSPAELIPEEFRPSGITSYVDGPTDELLSVVDEAWRNDEFVLEPTRMTLSTSKAGIDGDRFKEEILMDQFGLQVNKTSLNSVLFIGTIGVTWGGVAYLLDALKQEAERIETTLEGASGAELVLHDRRVEALTRDLPPLPNFSHFHELFRPNPETSEGDMRTPYFLNYEEVNREYIPLEEAEKLIAAGRELVCTTFIIPYPPGFPILVPGQVVSREILDFMQKLAIKEVHGYRAELGLPVFTQEALDWVQGTSHGAAKIAVASSVATS